MAEYINKAETLEEVVRFLIEEGSNTVCLKLCADIFNMPTIDIVHCSECIWMKNNGFCFNPKQYGYRGNDWFCAEGERKK